MPTRRRRRTPTAANPSALDLDGLTVGAAPKIAWSRGTSLNGDDAKKVLPAKLDQFVETKQLLVMRDVDGNVFAYSPDGPTSKTPIGKATGDLAVNDERNLVAWIAPDGSPTVLQEGEAKPATLLSQQGVTDGDAVAVRGHDCFNGPETVEGAGCSVYFRSRGEKPQSFVASNHGFVEAIGDANTPIQLQDADDVRPGRLDHAQRGPDDLQHVHRARDARCGHGEIVEHLRPHAIDVLAGRQAHPRDRFARL